MPNGAIFTTVHDLARFVGFELGHGPREVLQRSTLDDAFGGLVATDPFMARGYGLGFMSMRRDEFGYVGHNGSVAGYQAAMYFDRQMQVGVVLFRNAIGGKQEADRLAVDILSSLVSARQAVIQADIDKRFKAQTPTPGSEAAVRRIIEELRRGSPNYDSIRTGFARQTRRQLADEQGAMVNMGALQSLTFKRVGPAGPNIFEAKFEKGIQEWRIWFNPEGVVDVFLHRPITPPQ